MRWLSSFWFCIKIIWKLRIGVFYMIKILFEDFIFGGVIVVY